jgi:hypothetical protein
MFRFLKKFVALIALVGLVGGAQAYTEIGNSAAHNFGVLNTSQGVTVADFSDDFFNSFSFVAGPSPAVTGTFAGFDVTGDMQAQFRSGFGVAPALYTDGPSWSGLMPVPSDPLSGAFGFSQTFSVVSGQTYWFQLAGTAAQASYTITLAPVPEPESWALLLSGLGLMAFVARRRSNASAV